MLKVTGRLNMSHLRHNKITFLILLALFMMIQLFPCSPVLMESICSTDSAAGQNTDNINSTSGSKQCSTPLNNCCSTMSRGNSSKTACECFIKSEEPDASLMDISSIELFLLYRFAGHFSIPEERTVYPDLSNKPVSYYCEPSVPPPKPFSLV